MNALIVVHITNNISGNVKYTLLFWNRHKIKEMLRVFHRSPFLPDENRCGELERDIIWEIVKGTDIQVRLCKNVTMFLRFTKDVTQLMLHLSLKRLNTFFVVKSLSLNFAHLFSTSF